MQWELAGCLAAASLRSVRPCGYLDGGGEHRLASGTQPVGRLVGWAGNQPDRSVRAAPGVPVALDPPIQVIAVQAE